ncbi:metallophosphoesterase [Stomatohabitans albus]|uniref:metallophosphoesterase n=1 Tax=Stomatohabitans albus TaxID=3110766 RepID=UPI00300D081E
MSNRFIARSALGLAGMAATCFLYGVAIERRWYTTRFDTIHRDRPVVSPLRIALFSDLHYRPGQEHRLHYVMNAVVDAQPDLIVSAGDNLEHAGGMDAVIATHAAMTAALPSVPAIAALGAHDYWGPTPALNPFRYFVSRTSNVKPTGERFNTDRFIAGLEDAGWIVPVNGQGVLTSPQGRIHFSVVDDPHIGRDDLGAVAHQPNEPVVIQLGITHAPYRRVLDHYVGIGCDLILAGHTHGGQVCVPFYGALVTNCDLPPAQASGLSYHRDTPLVVTAGLGHSTYAPFRFACRPEVRIIDIQM